MSRILNSIGDAIGEGMAVMLTTLLEIPFRIFDGLVWLKRRLPQFSLKRMFLLVTCIAVLCWAWKRLDVEIAWKQDYDHSVNIAIGIAPTLPYPPAPAAHDEPWWIIYFSLHSYMASTSQTWDEDGRLVGDIDNAEWEKVYIPFLILFNRDILNNDPPIPPPPPTPASAGQPKSRFTLPSHIVSTGKFHQASVLGDMSGWVEACGEVKDFFAKTKVECPVGLVLVGLFLTWVCGFAAALHFLPSRRELYNHKEEIKALQEIKGELLAEVQRSYATIMELTRRQEAVNGEMGSVLNRVRNIRESLPLIHLDSLIEYLTDYMRKNPLPSRSGCGSCRVSQRREPATVEAAATRADCESGTLSQVVVKDRDIRDPGAKLDKVMGELDTAIGNWVPGGGKQNCDDGAVRE